MTRATRRATRRATTQVPGRPPMRLRKKIAFAMLASLAGLLLIEGACRLLLALRRPRTVQFQVTGGSVDTDWLGILAADLDFTDPSIDLYVEDRELFWRLRPNTRATVTNLVYQTRGEPPSWSLSINADGHRGPAYSAPGSATPLVICLGDSCTFGFRVSDDETYPAQLGAYLRQRVSPNAAVLNYGVPGYTTYQGRILLDQILARHTPDVVVLAFGANDLEQDRHSDAEKAARLHLPMVDTPQVFERLALVQLLRGTQRSRRTEGTVAETETRVSPAEYRQNLQYMVRAAQQKGCRVILLDLVFLGALYRDTIAEVAAENGLPWLDGREALRSALADLLAGKRFRQEKEALDRFWSDELLRFRAVYYSEEFYQQLFADEVWAPMLKYLMVEPVHANPLGNRIIAERLGELIAQHRQAN